MAAVSFPALVPSSRSYEPGVFPETQFQAQNGAVVRVRYGNQRAGSRLSLTFANITDTNASLILQNYVDVMDDDNYAEFTSSNVAAGAGDSLVPWIRETNSLLKWKYASPPSVTSVKPGLSTVTCEFIGELEGA
jgi:hypothetical protein|tara:strand:+ start:802 stop:1203 length:402 start_codon:yes stop_codon:yes gene_type:complete